MATETPVTVTKGFFDTIVTKIKTYFAQFVFSWKMVTELAFGFGGGFLFGFLVKRYARQTIFVLILFFALLVGLDYFKFITVDWTAFKQVVGLSSDGTLGVMAQQYFAWAKENILVVFVGVIGFIIGYKVG